MLKRCAAAGCLFSVMATAADHDVRGLAWMAGCWTMTEGPLVIEEQWSKPAGGTMLGLSRTLKANRTVFSEFMQIAETGGAIIYTARIGPKQQGTPFKLTRLSETEAVFENPKHDFPQRITYQRRADGTLFARVDGVDKGKARAEEFPMRRTPCE